MNFTTGFSGPMPLIIMGTVFQEEREKHYLNSRLCDFLEKGKEKELPNILFSQPRGESQSAV
jgi:hypothetical protein